MNRTKHNSISKYDNNSLIDTKNVMPLLFRHVGLKNCGKKKISSFVIFLMITFYSNTRKRSIYHETRASNFSSLQVFFHHLFVPASGFRHEVFKPIHTLVKVVYFLTHPSSCKRVHIKLQQCNKKKNEAPKMTTTLVFFMTHLTSFFMCTKSIQLFPSGSYVSWKFLIQSVYFVLVNNALKKI